MLSLRCVCQRRQWKKSHFMLSSCFHFIILLLFLWENFIFREAKETKMNSVLFLCRLSFVLAEDFFTMARRSSMMNAIYLCSRSRWTPPRLYSFIYSSTLSSTRQNRVFNNRDTSMSLTVIPNEMNVAQQTHKTNEKLSYSNNKSSTRCK